MIATTIALSAACRRLRAPWIERVSVVSTTASVSSSVVGLRDPLAAAGVVALPHSSRTVWPVPVRCTAIEAAAPTAHSNGDTGPRSAQASERVSRNRVALLGRKPSSWRTIRAPVRALVRQ